MKKFIACALAAVMATGVFAGCGSKPADSSATEGGSAAAGETVKLGVLAPLTGDVSAYGVSTKNGIEMAVKEINANGGILGRQIELLVQDEKGEVAEAVNGYNKLVSQGMVALIGDVTSKPAYAVAQKAADAKDGTPVLTPTGTAANITPVGENIFRTCFLDPFQGEIMATFAADKLGAKKVAVMYDSSNDYSQGIAASFTASAEAKGMEVVASEAYGADDKDFKTQLTKIVAAQPDVLFLPDYYAKIALIATQARQVGYEGPMMGADGWDGVLGVLDDANKNVVDNCYFSNHYFIGDTSETVSTFVNNYKTAYGTEPTAFSALGYDSVYIMKAAIEKAGSTEKAAIVEAMKATDYEGVTGHMTFDENGDPIKSVAVIKILNGEVTLDSMMDV